MIRNALRRFMIGRYGTDPLNFFLVGIYMVLFLVFFRMFSRNLAKRRAENAKFMRKMDPLVRWWRLRRTIRRDKEHSYFKCPSCGQQLRVPRGKGKITVTCRGCGASFQEYS